jgi:hypothetical protein
VVSAGWTGLGVCDGGDGGTERPKRDPLDNNHVQFAPSTLIENGWLMMCVIATE